MRLLYFLEESYGGVADYAHEQANALEDIGVRVTLLTTPKYPTGRGERYAIVPGLVEMKPDQPISNPLKRRARYISIRLGNYKRLAKYIEKKGFDRVLIGSYSEYFAPLWSGQLRGLAARGIVFGSVIHDPVRDYVVGPLWWHRRSVADSYRHLREAFVHEAIELDTVRPCPNLRTTVIPTGTFPFPDASRDRSETRASLDIPENAPLLLAFGNIRDGKNLDLVVKSLVENPAPYLIVAGTVQSTGQKQVSYYRNLAESLGVASRCRWIEQYVPAPEVANLFAAADGSVLTYSGSFRSSSTVLGLTVHFRVPCIASSGEGPLRTLVKKYDLGTWVEPDDEAALRQGIGTFLSNPPRPDWDRFLAENSWLENARLIRERMFQS